MSSTVIARRSVSTQRRPAQRVERLVDALARGADPARELLLRDREVDAHAAAGLLAPVVGGQLDQPRRDAADRVGGAELRALAVGLAQPRDQARRGSTATPAASARGTRGSRARGDHERLDRVDGGHARRARLPVDRRQLAEHLARPAEGEHGLAPVLRGRRDLHAPLGQQHHAVGDLALVEQRGPRAGSGAPRPARAAARPPPATARRGTNRVSPARRTRSSLTVRLRRRYIPPSAGSSRPAAAPRRAPAPAAPAARSATAR